MALMSICSQCNTEYSKDERSAICPHERFVSRNQAKKIDPPPGYANGGSAKNVKVPDRLAALGDIYRDRNARYGDTYKRFGSVMRAFFPNGLTLETIEDWNRLALYFHCADKLARYAGSFKNGHVDSLDDLSVYSQMLQEYDQDVRNGTQPR